MGGCSNSCSCVLVWLSHTSVGPVKCRISHRENTSRIGTGMLPWLADRHTCSQTQSPPGSIGSCVCRRRAPGDAILHPLWCPDNAVKMQFGLD